MTQYKSISMQHKASLVFTGIFLQVFKAGIFQEEEEGATSQAGKYFLL